MANLHYKNAEINAPWWWKRLESALVFLFTGMIPLIGLTKSLPVDWTHDITLIVLPGLILFVKAVGIFFGESVIIQNVDVETKVTSDQHN